MDHEHREMSETRETVNADAGSGDPASGGGYRLRQGGRFHSFSQKKSHCEFFCEKGKKAPCCRRRFCHSPGEMPGLMNDRVSRVNNTTYAVAHPKGNFASGRAEDSILFHKILHIVQNFVKKIHKVPCCRRRNVPLLGQTSSLGTDRVSRINNRSYAVHCKRAPGVLRIPARQLHRSATLL